MNINKLRILYQLSDALKTITTLPENVHTLTASRSEPYGLPVVEDLLTVAHKAHVELEQFLAMQIPQVDAQVTFVGSKLVAQLPGEAWAHTLSPVSDHEEQRPRE